MSFQLICHITILQLKVQALEASEPDLSDQTHDVRRGNAKRLIVHRGTIKQKFFLLARLIELRKTKN